MPKLRYLCIQENNDHEGEKWLFYCKYTIDNNRDEWNVALKNLRDCLYNHSHDNWEVKKWNIKPSVYRVIMHEIPDDGGYKPTHNKGPDVSLRDIKRFVKCPVCIETAFRTGWYKGDFDIKCYHVKMMVIGQNLSNDDDMLFDILHAVIELQIELKGLELTEIMSGTEEADVLVKDFAEEYDYKSKEVADKEKNDIATDKLLEYVDYVVAFSTYNDTSTKKLVDLATKHKKLLAAFWL